MSIDEALEDTGLKMLVYSKGGYGKTVMCATAGKPTLIISAEQGLISIKGAPKFVKVAKITCFDDLDDIYDDLSEGNIPCSWVCLDSISDVAEVLLSEEKEMSKDGRQFYGNLADKMNKMIRKFRDLPNINVLFTCKQKRITDTDTGRTTYIPSLPGNQLTENINYMFDFVFALRIEEDDDGEPYRTLQCEPDNSYDAKSRGEFLNDFEPPNLKKLEMKIRGEDYEPYVKKTKVQKEKERLAAEKEAEEKELEENEIDNEQTTGPEVDDIPEDDYETEVEETENNDEDIEEETAEE